MRRPKFLSTTTLLVIVAMGLALFPSLAMAKTASASAPMNEYPVPTLGSVPQGITAGPDGNLWFTEFVGNKIGKITTSGAITEYSGLSEGDNILNQYPSSSCPYWITVGPDGALWFTERFGNRIGRITTSGVITEYPLLGNPGGQPLGITAGPDGNLWLTVAGALPNRVYCMTTSGGITAEYDYKLGSAWSSDPWGITAGPDGALWFLLAQGGNIERLTTNGWPTELNIQTRNSYPQHIITGPDGNLWFTESIGNKIGKITTLGVITEYPLPTSGSVPEGITAGPDGALWFAEWGNNKIGHITTSGVITEYPIPTANSKPRGITAGPDGNIWFTEDSGNKIGRVLLNSPVPTTTTLSPTSKIAGQPDFTLTVNGTAFNSSSVVRWKGTDLSTKYISDTQLTAAIPASDIEATGTADVTVFNPAPGGGTSNARTFTINPAPVPTTTILSPDHKTARGPDFTLTVNGTKFVSGLSVVKWNGEDRITTYVSDTQLKAAITAADIATARTANVTVFNPAPGGGTSNALTFTINPVPVPTTTNLSLDHKTAGDAGFTLTVNGSNFVSGSKVRWKGSDRATTYVSPTKLTAVITAADISTAGTAAITVLNPTGGLSNEKTFTIENPVPNIDSISPPSKTAGESSFTLTVNGTNFVAGSVAKWNGEDRITTYVSDAQLTAAITAADVATGGMANVTVSNPAPGGGTSKAQTFTVTTPTWYLAEGSTAWGFDCYITIENPNASEVTANITYILTDGPNVVKTVSLPAIRQTTINPADDLGNKDFSAKVECTDPTKTIAVDRTMTWTGPGAPSPEAHSSTGVTSPAKTWYLPEGSSNWGFECWLLIQNPSASVAHCKVTYMTADAGPKVVNHDVAAHSRASFSMVNDIGVADASIKVEANVGVIPERAMYRNNRREGHDSIGTTTPAADYYLAEGTSANGFTTYVLVQNPNAEATDVEVTYMTPTGPKPQAVFKMPPNSRKTIRVNDVAGMESIDFSTQVHGTNPIIAERAMYWDNGTGEACHDSIGMDKAHTTFYLPDGQTSKGRETYTLVQNPNSSAVQVEISYFTPNGLGNVVKTETIPAYSRRTFGMLENSGINGRAAIMVTSKTVGKKIMVERAMYWNSRGAGTDTIGGYGD